jgi:hypothetical protein
MSKYGGIMRQKVIAIGLDSFDATLAERFMAEGHMPVLADLRKRAARFLLDAEPARRTGLPWEHVASGLSPEVTGRWGPIDFDPASYTAWQDGPHFAPWWTETDLRVVVFDTPFVDLRRARNTQGIVAWGSHSWGTATAARPAALLDEFVQRFGEYPATKWIYARRLLDDYRKLGSTQAVLARELGMTLAAPIATQAGPTNAPLDLFRLMAPSNAAGVETAAENSPADAGERAVRRIRGLTLLNVRFRFCVP